MNQKVMMIAGEASGDLYGAHLAQAMLTTDPTLTFFGMGGPKMKAAGVNTLVDAATVSVVGVAEVFTHFGTILKAIRTLKDAIKKEKPALLILIDFPDFNFHIAKFAKKLNIKIFYYISPQIWAWRKGRIKTIKKLVDQMTVILPFELDFYNKANVPACFEGHPLIDMVKSTQSKETLQQQLGLTNQHPIIGLLPGSRHGEIKRLLPTLIETAELLIKSYPNAAFVLPLAPTLQKEELLPHIKAHLPIHIVQDSVYNVLPACDVAITVSGTVTLETTLLEVPMVIIYKLKKFSFFIGKLLINIPHIGLCNLIANERIVPELIQDEANSTNIANEVKKILDNPTYRQTMQNKLRTVKNMLGAPGANQRIAQAALRLMHTL